MVNYRRSRLAGGTFFFTINLHDRSATTLIDHVDAFRDIVSDVKTKLPFVIDAMVVLPNHWHAVWTLPPDDADYTRQLQLIKARFTKHVVREGANISKDERGEYKLWQKRFWEHTIRDDRDFEAHVNFTCISIRSNMVMLPGLLIGRIRRFIGMLKMGCWQRIGRVWCMRGNLVRSDTQNPECATLLPGYDLFR